MVNFGFGLAGFIGLALVAAGVGLYVLRSLRPTLARDHDIFFAAVALLCGGILMFQGWRLDPILLFGQFLMTGSAAFFAVESIRLRGIVTQQAKRNSPIVDDERSVSSNYQAYDYEPYEAELEEIEPAREYPPKRTDRYIPGSRDSRRPAREAYSRDPYATQSDRRRPPSRSASGTSRPAPASKKRTRPSRSSESTRRAASSYDGWEEPGYADDRSFDRASSRSRATRSSNAPSSTKRSRPSSDPYASPTRDLRVDATPVDYTDYDRPSSSRSSGDYDSSSRDYRDGNSSSSSRGGTSSGYDDYSTSSYSGYSLDDDDTGTSSTDYTQYPYTKPPTAKPKKDLDLKSPPSGYDDYSSADYDDREDNSAERFDNY